MNMNNKLEIEFYAPYTTMRPKKSLKSFFWKFPIWSGQPNKIVSVETQ